MADIAGKTFSQLTPISTPKDTTLFAVDDGGTECNSLSVGNLREQLFDYYRAKELLVLDNLNATLNNRITNCILKAPNGVMTFSATLLTAKAGLQVVMPNGRDSDGALINVTYTLPTDISRNFTWDYPQGQVVLLKSDGTLDNTGNRITYIESEKMPVKRQYTYWLDTKNNQFKYIGSDTSSDWVIVQAAKIGYIYGNASGIVRTEVCYPSTLMSQDLNGNVPYVVQFESSTPAIWYRKWSNGILEQGGRLVGTSQVTYTFPIPFETTPAFTADTMIPSYAGGVSGSAFRRIITNTTATVYLDANITEVDYYAVGFSAY